MEREAATGTHLPVAIGAGFAYPDGCWKEKSDGMKLEVGKVGEEVGATFRDLRGNWMNF